MSFKKLALVTAMFAATSGAYAMEAMDEEALAATTGQDGITINLSTSAAVDVIIHDKDGFTDPQGVVAQDRLNSGAIVMRGISLAGVTGAVVGDALIQIDIDAGASAAAANDATLNIGVTLGDALAGTNTRVDLGELRVANSAREGGAGWGINAPTESATLLDLGTLTIGAGATLNIQLGNEPQGHLIVLDATLNGGLSLANVSLNDVGGALSGGSISVGALTINDAGAGADLTTNIGIDATATGLVLTMNQLGVAGVGAGTGIDLTMETVSLGGSSIGDVEIVGLNLNGDTIRISGH